MKSGRNRFWMTMICVNLWTEFERAFLKVWMNSDMNLGKFNFERNMAGIYCEEQWFAATVERKLQLWNKIKWNSVGLLLHENAVCKLSKKIWTKNWKFCNTFQEIQWRIECNKLWMKSGGKMSECKSLA